MLRSRIKKITEYLLLMWPKRVNKVSLFIPVFHGNNYGTTLIAEHERLSQSFVTNVWPLYLVSESPASPEYSPIVSL